MITGGGTGIGAACARLTAPRATGCLLPAGAKRRCRLSPMRPAPRRWWAMPPTARCGASGCYRRSSTRPAGLMSLICSAGGMGNSPAADTSDRQWREALDANLNSAFVSVRACLPSLDCLPRQCAVCRLHRLSGRRAAGLWLCHRQTRVNWPDALHRPRLRPTGRPRQCDLSRLGHHSDGG